MSADSSLRSGGPSSKGSHGHSRPTPTTIVRPQPVIEKTLMESVAGLINEVGLVPQPYSTTEEKEGCIVWAKFVGKVSCSLITNGSSTGSSNATVNHDLKSGVDSMLSTGESSLPPASSTSTSTASSPLLLVIAYPSGVQMWAISLNGEAQEVLSWKRPSVRLFQLLPTPSVPVGREPLKDTFVEARPVVALVEGSSSGPNHLTFISLRTGEVLKSAKFIHSVCDLIANSAHIVVTFLDKILVIDPFTFETKATISIACSSTTQAPTVNPVALGASWLAYSDHKLFPTLLSAGGVENSAPSSYTATMLHAAKSLTKGLKGLGESVANSISGHRVPLPSEINPEPVAEDGIVTVVNLMELKSEEFMMSEANEFPHSAVVAHFVAHLNNPCVALNFDPSGLLLVTADKGGHDFHVFRVHPHPLGSAMGAVHHLYVLHRGDTGARVQDVSFAPDSRWVAVSTLRGTTHIFPITPYGGGICVRTHTSHRVVNRLSRFHRTAGLDDTPTSGRNSPITSGSPSNPLSPGTTKSYDLLHLGSPYPNPRLPPFPHPLVVQPLAQLRQSFIAAPSTKGSPPIGKSKSGSTRTLLPHEERTNVVSTFDAPRGWVVNGPPLVAHCDKRKRAPVDAVFVMTCHGNLIEYFLEPILSSSIPKEKVSDDAPIELTVHARAQWTFPRPTFARDLNPPLGRSNLLLSTVLAPVVHQALVNHCNNHSVPNDVHINSTGDPHPQTNDANDDEGSDEKWLSQVEITTHSGPHRRLWMGPQFTFKVFNPSTSGNQAGTVDVETVEVNVTNRPAKSNPVNMPVSSALLPVVIEGSSGSSLEQSPRLIDPYCESEASLSNSESQIKENLADAMMENCAVASRNTGGCQSLGSCDDLSSSSFDSMSQHSAETPLVPSFCIEANLPFPD